MSNISHTTTGAFSRVRPLSVVVGRSFGVLAVSCDIAIIVAMSVAAGTLYHLAMYGNLGLARHYLLIGGFTAAVFVGLRAYDRRYQIERVNLEKDRFRNIAVVWNVAFLCLFAVGFMIKETDVYSAGRPWSSISSACWL